MTQTSFVIGADVSCTDGSCGHLNRVVIDPVSRVVTHLVVGPRHRLGHDLDRLVPIDLAEPAADRIRLRCTKDEFEKLDPAEEQHFLDPAEDTELEMNSGHLGYQPDQVLTMPYYGLGGVWTEGRGWDPGGRHGPRPRLVTYDSVPLGEVQVRRGDRVHATDGEIGLVEGLVIDPENHQVTHVLLQEGHLWGRKEVAIPIGAVTGVDGGIRLNLSKQQVENLPQVDVNRRRPEAAR